MFKTNISATKIEIFSTFSEMFGNLGPLCCLCVHKNVIFVKNKRFLSKTNDFRVDDFHDWFKHGQLHGFSARLAQLWWWILFICRFFAKYKFHWIYWSFQDRRWLNSVFIAHFNCRRNNMKTLSAQTYSKSIDSKWFQ